MHGECTRGRIGSLLEEGVTRWGNGMVQAPFAGRNPQWAETEYEVVLAFHDGSRFVGIAIGLCLRHGVLTDTHGRRYRITLSGDPLIPNANFQSAATEEVTYPPLLPPPPPPIHPPLLKHKASLCPIPPFTHAKHTAHTHAHPHQPLLHKVPHAPTPPLRAPPVCGACSLRLTSALRPVPLAQRSQQMIPAAPAPVAQVWRCAAAWASLEGGGGG